MAKTRCKIDSKQKKSSTSEKKKSARMHLQKYRDKLKNDSQKLAEVRAKDRERKRKAKEEGKIKSILELSEREKRKKRKHHRDYMREYRQRKKQDSASKTDICIEESLQEPHVPCQACNNITPNQEGNLSAQKKRGRRIVLKNRSALNRENKCLRNKNMALQRLIWRMKKRSSRDKKKSMTNLTPKSKLGKVTEGRKISSNVRRELFKGLVLEEELKRNVKDIGTSMRKKTALANVLSGRVIKKYRLQNQFKFLPLKSLRRNHELRSSLFDRVKPEQIIKTRKAVIAFFLSDHASHFGPEKKSFVKIKGEKIQKRFLNDCLVSLHKIFLEVSEAKVSFSTFCKYKPKEVVPPKLSERDSCLCKKCENFKLLCKALRTCHVLVEKNPRDLINSLCCSEKTQNCRFRTCLECKDKSVAYQDHNGEDPCKYFRWELCKETRNGNSEKQICVTVTKKVEVKCSIQEAKNELEKAIYERIAHEGRITQQINEWKYLQDSMTKEDVLLNCDWSENWETKCSAEIQSMHFGGSRQQFSLHTGFVQTTERKETFCTLSDVTRHDPIAIYAHLKPILERHITAETKYLHFKTDGPTTQYRNKKMFYIVSQYISRRFPDLQKMFWNYSEAGHGKDVADGVGGTVKRTVDSAIAHGADIQSLDQFVEVLRQKEMKTYIRVITKNEIDEADRELIIPEFKHFPGTMQIHQYVWVCTRPTEIICKSLSCYRCPRKYDCGHYVLGHPYQMPELVKPKIQTSKKKSYKQRRK